MDITYVVGIAPPPTANKTTCLCCSGYCVWEISHLSERGNENACGAHNVFIPHYGLAIQYSWPGLGKRPWYVAHHEYTTTEWLSHKTHCNPKAPCWLWYPDCGTMGFWYLVQSVELSQREQIEFECWKFIRSRLANVSVFSLLLFNLFSREAAKHCAFKQFPESSEARKGFHPISCHVSKYRSAAVSPHQRSICQHFSRTHKLIFQIQWIKKVKADYFHSQRCSVCRKKHSFLTVWPGVQTGEPTQPVKSAGKKNWTAQCKGDVRHYALDPSTEVF